MPVASTAILGHTMTHPWPNLGWVRSRRKRVSMVPWWLGDRLRAKNEIEKWETDYKNCINIFNSSSDFGFGLWIKIWRRKILKYQMASINLVNSFLHFEFEFYSVFIAYQIYFPLDLVLFLKKKKKEWVSSFITLTHSFIIIYSLYSSFL